MISLRQIEVNPRICHGKPVIRGTRIMVWQILDLLQSGLTFQQIRKDYFPQLTQEDIQACVQYANALIQHEEVHLVGASKAGRLPR
jgi:uncharacterized protein (DUF433 family)